MTAELAVAEVLAEPAAVAGADARRRRVEQRELMGANVDLDRLFLDPIQRHVPGVNVVNSVVRDQSEVTRSMDAASTVTLALHDPDALILRSGLLEVDARDRLRTVDVELDGLRFRLVKAAGQGSTLVLTFEALVVALLRDKRSRRKASRGDVTRAEFARSLVKSVRHPVVPGFWSPDLHDPQPIAHVPHADVRSLRDAQRHPGLDAGARVTVKGRRASAEQRGVIEVALSECDDLSAPRGARKALLLALVEESACKNLRGGDADSSGALQVRRGTARSLGINARDVQAVCRTFLKDGFWKYRPRGAIELAKQTKMSAAQIAQACQGSGPARYAKWNDDAERALRAWGAGHGGGSVAFYKNYEFTVGPPDGPRDESYWDALGRLAEQVRWRRFESAGTVYYAAETTLAESRARMAFSRDTEGVDSIDFDWDEGKVVKEATVECRINRWAAPPGAAVVVEGHGPATGRWIVSEVTRPLFSAAATVTLRKAVRPKPEPRAELVSRSVSERARGGLASVPEEVQKAYAKAKAITKRHYPYVWGGGHNAGFRGPYDCSGAASAALHAAGLLKSPLTSGGLEGWGHRGKGRYMTVYASGQHAFMEFHLPGRGVEHFGTGRWGTHSSGAGFKPKRHPHAGFAERHWPGT